MKIQNELNYMQEDLNKLVKGGWGPRNRANQYVKKNSGVGGGYSAKMDHSPSPQANNKSHKEHIEQLRQFIKKSAQQHGKKDKFVFYPEKQNAEDKKEPRQAGKSKPKSKKKKMDQQSVDFELQEERGDQGAVLPDDSLGNPYANREYMGGLIDAE